MAEATTSRSVHAHDERSEQVSAATVTIADLASTLGATVLGSSAPSPVSVLSVTHDSRRVVPGALFCCVVGATADGHEFAASAVAAMCCISARLGVRASASGCRQPPT